MCSFDLLLLKNRIIGEYESNHFSQPSVQHPTELFVSDRIAQAIINLYGEDNELVDRYYSHVRESAVAIGKELIVDIIGHETDYIAETLADYPSKIDINLSSRRIHFGDQNPSNFISIGNVGDVVPIFIHELGEAAFLTEQYCNIIDLNDREVGGRSFISILKELFSHTYISAHLERFGLSGHIDYNIGIGTLETNFLKEKEPWKRFLNIVHALASSPYIYERREEMIGYSEFTYEIDRTMEIIRDQHLFDSRENFIDASERIIEIFSGIGITDLRIVQT